MSADPCRMTNRAYAGGGPRYNFYIKLPDGQFRCIFRTADSREAEIFTSGYNHGVIHARRYATEEAHA